ncbi:MxaK protein [methane-oxidizing endosymbiont of Gigantopelta aegis]|uniref:MxaK protein n=1 Tax=methane-oxidizing endosymbiont of Gigantopelta aegis TaxID=2794938 RepID=UPI0018DD22CC|nr:MxaK protein [methane-oxidizing endosymbiont of Gigantopelta aegis]
MIRVARFYAGWGGLLIALVVTLQSSYAYFQIIHINQLITQLNQGKAITPALLKNTAPELQLAYAGYLKKKHRYQDAQVVLGRIINQGSRHIQTITRYNLGNLYLSEAIELAEAMQINEAMALSALAKQAYRQALALDSQYWDAKYNLEVAMRLLPEMDRITLEQDEPIPEKKTKLWATVPGFPRGLP